MMCDKKVETDDSLLEEYLLSKSQLVSISLANQHLDQAVGEEIGKTINVLNEYVSKVQLS